MRTLCPTCRAQLATRLGQRYEGVRETRSSPSYSIPSRSAPTAPTSAASLPPFTTRLTFRPFEPKGPVATLIPIQFRDHAPDLADRYKVPIVPWETLQEYFPKATPRPGQQSLIQLIAGALEAFDDVIVEAPTGLGKSAIATTLTRYAAAQQRRSFLVVHRNGLLDQYQADHPDLALIKGMNNYPCVLNDNQTGCDQGPCQTRTNFRCSLLDRCEYFGPHGAREHAKASVQVLSNYDYLYWAGSVSEQFTPRDLMILDEAHRVEETLLRSIRVQVSDAWAQGLSGRNSPGALVERLGEAKAADAQAKILEDLHQRIAAAFAAFGTPDRVPPLERRRYEGALAKIEFLALELRHRPENWVVETKTDLVQESGPRRTRAATVEFKPITIAPYAAQLLSLGAKRVHLSATILDHMVHMRSLGIERACVLKVVESPFPVQNRPIYSVGVARLTRDSLQSNLPRIHQAIDTILEKHPNEKGIILPFSHFLRESIMGAALRQRARLVTHGADADERDRVLDGFMQDRSSNRVLVSTYAGEGLDFIGDLARFSIIVKSPYPNLGDPQVAARQRQNQAWYDNETLKSVIQMAGRVCRSETDRGTTYILDQSVDVLLQRYRHLVPKWFWDAYKGIPTAAWAGRP